MSGLFRRLGLAVALALPGVLASAATLHRPLPPDSLEPNGVPENVQQDGGDFAAPPAALPEKGLLRNAAAGLKRPYGGTPIDVLTYHYDPGRTGWNQSETDLTPATVGSANFGQLTTLDVDGIVLSQPLLVSGFTMPDGTTHDVLIVVTEHNSVYAFDAQSYATLWQANLGPSQSSKDVGCVNVEPEYGISGTPVIVRGGAGSATIYLVSATEPAHLSFHTQLHALDLGTGLDVVTPAEIAPSAGLKGGGTVNFDPQNQWNRPALAYSGNGLYIAIGSHCDHNPDNISGWLLNYDPATLALAGQFHTIETAESYELASIWMSGFAPAIGPTGNVFVVTGNGAVDISRNNWGESVLNLPADLRKHVQGYFTSIHYKSYNNHDVDFGSGGVMLLPVVQGQTAPPMAVAMGKSAVLYLLDQNNLGGLQQNDAGALNWQNLRQYGKGLWGGPSYYGSPNGGLVYVQITGDVLRSFSVATGSQPALTQAAVGTSPAGPGGSLSVVSSNGAMPNTGVVWVVRRGATIQLEAYDALALGNPIFAANAGVWSKAQGNAFVTAMEANGRVYVPGYRTVTVFGLAQ